VSYSSGFGLVVLAKEDIPAYFGDRTASLLLGDELPALNKVTPEQQQLRKRMSGQTRNNCLKYVSKGVFDKIGSCDTLRFVSEERYTHTEVKQGDDKSGYEYQYTLIKGRDIDVILQDIDKFFIWCGANIQIASILINCSEGEVRDGVFNSYYCEDPNKQAPHGEDGDSGQFLFCVIKTIQALLFYAKNNNLCAIYSNAQYVSVDQKKQPVEAAPAPVMNEPRYAAVAANLPELQQGDFGEARAMLAKPGSYSTEAFYEHALKIYKPGDNEALTFAFDLHRQAALKGHPEAQFQLAFMYTKGFGTRQSFASAVSWYRKSAEQGYDEAQIALARLYEAGTGVPKDLKLAKSWYEKAAKQGHPDAIAQVPEKKQSSGFLSWVTNISLLFLIVIALYATGQSFIQDWQFSNHGQQAVVEPIMQYEEVTRTQKKMGITTSESKSYNAEITFTTSANERIRVRKGIPKEVLEKFVNDRPVYIKYLPEEPRTTRFPEEGSGSMVLLFFVLVLCGVFYFLIRKR